MRLKLMKKNHQFSRAIKKKHGEIDEKKINTLLRKSDEDRVRKLRFVFLGIHPSGFTFTAGTPAWQFVWVWYSIIKIVQVWIAQTTHYELNIRLSGRNPKEQTRKDGTTTTNAQRRIRK